MHVSIRSLALASALSALAPLASAGDPVPLTTWTWDFGSFDFNGPGISISPFGPEAAEPVWKTRIEVEFDANGSMPASDLFFQVVLPIDGTSVLWQFTGADLGFPSAGGSYSSSLETDLFAGLVTKPQGFPFTPLEVLMSTTSGPMIGHMESLTLTFEIGPRLLALGDSVSLSAGGAQNLRLTAGPTVGPATPYWMLGSVTGTGPGFALGAVEVPLNFDGYTNFLLLHPNSAVLPASLGALGPDGKLDTVFQLPPGTDPSLAGLTLNHSFLVFQPGSSVILSASNPVAVALVP